jgi:ABC-2 type transport system ATP-binding protein
MTTPILRAERLTKRYGAKRGVEDLTFEVRPGEVFGFLGPNGAGKTTTMRVLLDFLRPTEGRIEAFGLDSREGGARIRERVGYLPSDAGIAERLSAREQLTYYGNLRGGVPPERIESLAKRLQLDLDRPVRALSRGNKQKVGIVQAFMHDPELLILDEPTSGLDPLMQQAFNDLVREAKSRGRTVFLSSHILPEVEALCDRVGIIREGRLVAVEDMATVKARALRRLEARFATEPSAKLLADVPDVEDVRVEGRTLTCRVRGEVGAVVKALAATDLVDLVTREPSLEDVFLGFYGGGAS